MIRSSLVLALCIAAGSTVAGAASGPVSTADRNFVAMVSQGGMFEVQAGAVGASQGSTQDIKDQGTTEQHDHQIVGQNLRAIADAAGLAVAPALNAGFAQELASLKRLSGAKFDAAYLGDMEDVHAKDGAAFAKEATGGTNPDLRAFAMQTHRIVVRHIGELKALGPAGQ